MTKVLDYLKDLHEKKYPEKPKRQRRMKGPVFIMNHSLETRSFVIWLRYGSTTKECDPPLRSFRDISRITGVKVCSCMTIVRNWIKYGHEVVNYKGKYERKLWYTEDMKKFLLNP